MEEEPMLKPNITGLKWRKTDCCVVLSCASRRGVGDVLLSCLVISPDSNLVAMS